MFERIVTFFANNPRIKAVALFIAELEKFIATGAVITYMGKPCFDKDGNPNSTLMTYVKRGGKIALACGTLGGTLIYDIITDPTVSVSQVTDIVDVTVNLKHDEIRQELIRALSSANESAAKLNEMLVKLTDATPAATKVVETVEEHVEAPAEQLHAPAAAPVVS